MSRNAMSDEQILDCLHMRDHLALTSTVIAERMRRGRGSVIGAMSRADKKCDESDPDGNQNGTMPPRWWKR
jgi:hypothetical protein